MNLASILDGHPDASTALVAGDQRISYGQLRQQVAHIRQALARRQVIAGDRVAVLAENSIGIVAAYFAILGLGAIAVPLNPLAPTPALNHEINTVGATLTLIDRGAPRDDLATVLISDLLGEPSGEPVGVHDGSDDSVAVLMFTSGTAGAPRAAMLTHGNLWANLDQSRHEQQAIHAGDIVLGLLPLHHIFGLNVMLSLALISGATVVLTSHFDPEETLALLVSESITVVPGVPTMWVAWSKAPGVDLASFAHVRLALTGAAHLAEAASRAFTDRTGLVIREGYGLTEASPVVTTSMMANPRVGSIGTVLHGVQLRLVDDDGDDALAGDPGEVWVKGPNVFPGYWNDAEATARVLTADGWLRTGDVAIVDEEGFLYLVDRSKDLIIVSGFNVFPAEVEETLLLHPAVAEAAVVGVPHASTGEAVQAFVVLQPGATVTDVDLQAHCRTYLARYKCPGTVAFLDALPRGLGGKVLRRLLR